MRTECTPQTNELSIYFDVKKSYEISFDSLKALILLCVIIALYESSINGAFSEKDNYKQTRNNYVWLPSSFYNDLINAKKKSNYESRSDINVDFRNVSL